MKNIISQFYPFSFKFILASIVCGLAGCFYLYEFILQVAPAVMTSELMRDLKIDAVGLGTISAFYYLIYTPMQIPAGLLFDRYGTRILLTLATFICALGAIFFSMATGIELAALGRACMGFGSAFAFIGSLMLLTYWFPPHLFALLAGIIQLMSAVGAIAGEAPLATLANMYGWRSTILALGIAGLLLGFIIWLIVRDKPVDQSTNTVTKNTTLSRNELLRLKKVCSQKQNWLVGLYSYLNWWPITIFAALWGVPFLIEAYNISVTQAANACSMIWLGIGIGSPLIGWWSDKIKRRILPLALCAGLGILSTGILIYFTHLTVFSLYLTLFLFGLAASGQSLSFALVSDNNPTSVVGTAIGFNNMAVVLGGIFQSLIGIILQWLWDGTLTNNVPVYHTKDYQIALAIIPVCYLISLLLCKKGLRESHCQKVLTTN